MIDSVKNRLYEISEYAQKNILISENEYENEAFQHGIVVFKVLLSRMVDDFLEGKIKRCDNNQKPDNKDIEYHQFLANPEDLKYSQRYFHLAVRINKGINDESHQIYAAKINGHFKTVKYDFDQMNVNRLIDLKIVKVYDTPYLLFRVTYDNIKKLLYMAYKNELSGPYFDKKTIKELGDAYVTYVINKKKLNSFLATFKENAEAIYSYIYERLVSEYTKDPSQPKYIVKIELMNCDYVMKNFIASYGLVSMIDLFDNASYDGKDQILFPVIIKENGQKLFLPVQKSYFRSLFDGDSVYGFDNNQCTLYLDNNINNELSFTFNRSSFEAKVAGLKRVRKPNEIVDLKVLD